MGGVTPEYPELPARIAELGLKLQTRGDSSVAEDVRELLLLVDDFHRRGLTTLVGMIQSWRGEIFLESIERDEVTGPFLRAYNLPGSR